MVVLVANIVVQDGKADEFVKAANECIAETRKEEGNISYRLLAATDAPGSFSFVEEWADMDALQAHRKMPHYGAFNKVAAGLVAGPVQLNIYQAEKVG